MLAGVAAGMVGVVAFGAGPVAADTPATVSFTSPATDGITMTAPATLSGTVEQPQGVVDAIDVTVRWTDTVNRPPAPHPAQETNISPATKNATASWSFTPAPAANGRYTVTVVATTHTGTSAPAQATAARSFVLDVPPAIPANVAVTTDAAQRTAHLTWSANPEPDMVGYAVYRAGPGAADQAKPIAGVMVPKTDFTDTSVASQPAGTYRYSVAAVRQSGDGSKADFSAASGEVSATFTTPPKAQPAPTTSAPPPAAAGSGGSGGTVANPPTSAHPVAGPTVPAYTLAPPSRATLSDYQSLVNQAQASTATTEPPDPGFASKLPYQPKISQKVVQIPGAALESGTLGAADTSQGVRRTAEFVAAALVLAVLALFGWVLKRAADQPGLLEALAPAVDGPAAPIAVAASPAVVGSAPNVPAGPSLMLTIVRPATPDPTPVER
ncbi:MAG: hypothetical protein NVSMB12_17160 [Acidimicrobiales bacterium]